MINESTAMSMWFFILNGGFIYNVQFVWTLQIETWFTKKLIACAL